MLPQIQTNSKKKPPVYNNDNILEALRGIGAGVGKAVARDVVTATGGDILNSLVGNLPAAGELRPNQPLEFSPQPQAAEAAPRLAGRPEISLEPLRQAEQVQIQQQLAQVRAELKALTAAMKNLHQEIEKAIDEIPPAPGIYHLNFMDRLRSIIKILREQIDDSRSWLALTAQRKQKKLGYWGMFKKHGTSFGLSSERALATQAG